MLELPADIPVDVPGLWNGYAEWLSARGVTHPRVAIHGGYGKNNLGDDAILDVLLTRTLQHFPEAEITVVCHGPGNVRARYRELARLSACHFKSLDALRAVVRSHLYVIGGGGIVNRINTYSGRQRLRLLDMKGKYLFLAALAARLFGAHTSYYAIGATSFPDAGVKLLARWGFQHADVVSVRDRRSLANLRALGVDREIVLVRDPALSLTPLSGEEAEAVLARWNAAHASRPRVCIGFRYVREPGVSNEATVEKVAALARHLMTVGLRVVFLAASQHPSENYEDDLHFGRAVRQRLGSEERFSLVEEYCHPRLTMAMLGRMDLCILERLHAVVLALLAGAPVYAISYDQKVTEFVELAGRQRSMMELRDFLQQPSFDWIDPYLAALGATPEGS